MLQVASPEQPPHPPWPYTCIAKEILDEAPEAVRQLVLDLAHLDVHCCFFLQEFGHQTIVKMGFFSFLPCLCIDLFLELHANFGKSQLDMSDRVVFITCLNILNFFKRMVNVGANIGRITLSSIWNCRIDCRI